MKPAEYINFKQDDIKIERIEELKIYGQNDAADCIIQICKYIERLKDVRNSDKLTEKIVNELINSHTSIYGDPSETDKSIFIIRWLIKAMEVDLTYFKARLLLCEYQNRRAGRRTNQDIRHMSDIELFKRLREEEEEDNNSKSASTSKAAIKKVDHSDLLSSLSIYISGINAEGFNYFMQHHSLMPLNPKAKWEGKKVDAHRFATYIGISLPNFNKCFLLRDGKTLKHGDRDKIGKGSLLSKLITAHFKK